MNKNSEQIDWISLFGMDHTYCLKEEKKGNQDNVSRNETKPDISMTMSEPGFVAKMLATWGKR